MKRKWLIIITIFAVSIPWLIYLKGLPPTYEAFSIIQFRSLGQEVENLINRSRVTELKSRSFAERVVAQLGLTLEIKLNEKRCSAELFFRIFILP